MRSLSYKKFKLNVIGEKFEKSMGPAVWFLPPVIEKEFYLWYLMSQQEKKKIVKS